jgi:3-phenylpropionate/cinnamic acid dioxygenase small subunit
MALEALPSELQKRLEDALLRIEVEDYLWYEANLLDEHNYDEWIAQFTPDLKYWMPLRRNVASKEMYADMTKEEGEISWFNNDYTTLARRVAQVQTGVHWADEPLSRVTHVISNIRIIDKPAPNEVRVGSHFVFHRNRHQKEESVFYGRRIDTLRKVDGVWKIARREVYLDESVLLHKNLTSFF